jgi:hypothetical protein
VITPFSLKAKKYNILRPGGKLDDITVVCCQVNIQKIETNEDNKITKSNNESNIKLQMI